MSEAEFLDKVIRNLGRLLDAAGVPNDGAVIEARVGLLIVERDKLKQERDDAQRQLGTYRPDWTPGNHCPWNTKHGDFVYEYCSLPRGHDGEHRMDVVETLERERDEARAAVEHLGGACDYSSKVKAVWELYDKRTAERDMLRAEILATLKALGKLA